MESPYIIKTRRKTSTGYSVNGPSVEFDIVAYVVVTDEPIVEGDFFVHQQINPKATLEVMEAWEKSGKAYPQPSIVFGWGTETVKEAQVIYVHPASVQAGKPKTDIGWVNDADDKTAKELVAERGYPSYGCHLEHSKKVYAVLNTYKDTFETYNGNPDIELCKKLIEEYRYNERGAVLGEKIGAL